MPWRWVGLQDDQGGGSRQARITDEGELLVRLLSGAPGTSGDVEIVDITVDVPVKPAVGSPAFPVNVTGGSMSTGPIAQSGFGGLPRTVISPGADELITNHLPAVSGELHMVDIVAWFSDGAPELSDSYNVCFKFGDTVVSPIPVAAAVNMTTASRFYFTSATDTPFGVYTIEAATTGVAYNAFLTATRLA